MLQKIIGIIPARYASTRLAAKPLVDVAGLPMVIRVWKNIINSKLLDRVVIATDDERILNICSDYGAEAIMTPPELPSGTDRVFYAYEKITSGDTNNNNNNNNSTKQEVVIEKKIEEIVLNIQGDEPLLTSDTIDKLLEKFIGSSADVGTIITRISSNEDLLSPKSNSIPER